MQSFSTKVYILASMNSKNVVSFSEVTVKRDFWNLFWEEISRVWRRIGGRQTFSALVSKEPKVERMRFETIQIEFRSLFPTQTSKQCCLSFLLFRLPFREMFWGWFWNSETLPRGAKCLQLHTRSFDKSLRPWFNEE